jgi:hypothetical protein
MELGLKELIEFPTSPHPRPWATPKRDWDMSALNVAHLNTFQYRGGGGGDLSEIQ